MDSNTDLAEYRQLLAILDDTPLLITRFKKESLNVIFTGKKLNIFLKPNENTKKGGGEIQKIMIYE